MNAAFPHANNQELALFFHLFLCSMARPDTVKLNHFLAIDGYCHLGIDTIAVRLNSKQQGSVQFKSSL